MSEIIQNSPDEDQLYTISGFTEEEQQEIKDQIDQISEQNKIKVSDELFKITPTKKGGTLPLVINILGLIAIAAGFFIADRYFQNQENIMAMEESSYETAEGSVIEELKRQAEEKLNQKEQEISQIQQELQKLDQESASLKENMDSQIREKELELREQMESALAAERQRLQNQDISTEELERRLEEFQNARESDFEQAISTFRQESESALREKEEELARAKQVAQDILEQANIDKAAIEADTRKREDELKAQFEAEKEALARQTSEATQKLAALSELQKNEQLVQDQITGSYTSIINSMENGNYTEAQSGINEIRDLLNDPKITKLPAINKRKSIEFYLLDTLEKEIQQAGAKTTTDFSTMTRAAELLIAARQIAEAGVSAEAEGNTYEARRFYNEALLKLPQISRAVENLRELDSQDKSARAAEYGTLAEQALGTGDIDTAVKQFKSAALSLAPDNTESVETAITGIEQALADRNRRIQADLENRINRLETEAAAAEEKLSGNLEEKEAALAEKDEDVARLNTQVESLEKLTEELDAARADLQQQLDDLKSGTEKSDTEIKQLNDKLAASETKIEELNSRISESQETVEKLTAENKKASFAIDSLTKRAERAEQRAVVLESELNDAVNQIVELLD